MSAAEDLRAALAAHAPLVALVGQRIREDLGDEVDTYPLIVIKQVNEEDIAGLDGSVHAHVDDFHVESWGSTRAQSMEVHAVVKAALLAADFECEKADPNAIDPDIGARAGVWTVRIWDDNP